MAALLAKARAGNAAGYGPHGPWLYSWPVDGAAIEVPDYVLAELGAQDGFTVVYEPDPEPEAPAEASPEAPATVPAVDAPDGAPEPDPELTEPAAEANLSEIAPADPVVETPKPTGRRSK
jgi:hypothetical protein